MLFFNIDQHVSVIADLAHIFKSFGHQVDDWSLSGHHWVLNKPQPKIMLSNGTQLTCSGVCTQEVCDMFYEQNKEELSKYDAFIACYPVEFAMLYERFNKPIIVVNCVRYDHPNTFNPSLRSRLNEFLTRKNEEGTLHYVSNNKGDQWYTEYFTGIRPTHIPSLCEYTGAKYTGTKKQYVLHDRSEIEVPGNLCVSLGFIRSPGWRYTWENLYSYKGVVHVPYHTGSMSTAEQYTANMPLFLPSKTFLKELYFQGKTFQDLTFYKITKAEEPEAMDNPNSLRNPAILDKWIEGCDFYDEENMKHVQYFDSPQHLEHLLRVSNTRGISEAMRQHNQLRKASVYSKWKTILDKIDSQK